MRKFLRRDERIFKNFEICNPNVSVLTRNFKIFLANCKFWRTSSVFSAKFQAFKIFHPIFLQETLPRANLKVIDPVLLETPFLANHCVLEGFDDASKVEVYDKEFGSIVKEQLEFMSEVKLSVVKKQGDVFIVSVPKLKDLKPKSSQAAEAKPKSVEVTSESKPNSVQVTESKPEPSKESEKEKQIRKLREELAKLGAM